MYLFLLLHSNQLRRFGFTNQDALAAGETGTACRGEEHDITFVWSLTSGKRLILADGQEVHYSSNRTQMFDFSWTMRGNHVLKIIAHATPPMTSSHNFRQYDFFVDGMSFFNMPKVHRLGLVGSTPVHDSGALALAQSSRTGTYTNYNIGGEGSYYGGGPPTINQVPPNASKRSIIVEMEAPHNEQEEEAYLQEAIKASLSENTESQKRTLPPPPPLKEQDLLLDFGSEPERSIAPPVAPVTGSSNGYYPAAIVSAPPSSSSQFALGPSSGYGSYPGMAPSVPAPSVAAPSPVDPFAPGPYSSAPTSYSTSGAPFSSPYPPQYIAAPAPFTTQPAAQYTAANFSKPPAAAAPAFSQPPTFTAPVNVQPPSAPSSTPPLSSPAPSYSSGPVLTMAPQMKGLGTDANAAYAKFASMDQFDLVKPKGNQRANPFDAEPAPAVNQNATLGSLKSMHQGTEKKEVMKNSSMVVVQNQNGNWGGAIASPAQQQGYGMMGNTNQGFQQPPQYGGSMYGGYGQQQPPQYTGMGMQQQPIYGQQYQQPMNQGIQQPQYGAPQQQTQYGMYQQRF